MCNAHERKGAPSIHAVDAPRLGASFALTFLEEVTAVKRDKEQRKQQPMKKSSAMAFDLKIVRWPDRRGSDESAAASACRHEKGPFLGVLYTAKIEVSMDHYDYFYEAIAANHVLFPRIGSLLRFCDQCDRLLDENDRQIENAHWIYCCKELRERGASLTESQAACAHRTLGLEIFSTRFVRRYVYGNDMECDLACSLTTVQRCSACGAMVLGEGSTNQEKEKGPHHGWIDWMAMSDPILEIVEDDLKIPRKEPSEAPVRHITSKWYMPRD